MALKPSELHSLNSSFVTFQWKFQASREILGGVASALSVTVRWSVLSETLTVTVFGFGIVVVVL